MSYEKSDYVFAMDALDCDVVSVEEYDGEKYVHFSGYVWTNGDPEDKPYRILEYVWNRVPMSTYLAHPDWGSDEFNEYENDSHHCYIEDLSEAEYVDAMNHWFNNRRPKPISKITADTPCGDYILM